MLPTTIKRISMCLNCVNDKQLKRVPDFCSLKCMREYRETRGYCTVCKSSKNKDEMCMSKGKARGMCKECHAIEEKERWTKKPQEERQHIAKQYHKNFTKKRKEGYYSDEEILHKWCLRNVNRKKLKGGRDRENLSLETLKRLCNKSVELFPYISFNNFEDTGDKWAWASIDRIDPSRGYSDDNIVVVPLWLNSAKLDTTYTHLFELIKGIPENYLLNL